MESTRLVRTKGWCELYNVFIKWLPTIWKETTIIYGIDRLIIASLTDYPWDDSVDIIVSDRLGNYMITGRYGTGFGFSYNNCHHGLTLFSTTP